MPFGKWQSIEYTVILKTAPQISPGVPAHSKSHSPDKVSPPFLVSEDVSDPHQHFRRISDAFVGEVRARMAGEGKTSVRRRTVFGRIQPWLHAPDANRARSMRTVLGTAPLSFRNTIRDIGSKTPLIRKARNTFSVPPPRTGCRRGCTLLHCRCPSRSVRRRRGKASASYQRLENEMKNKNT